MPALYLLLFLALSVKDDGTALRNGCSADSDVIAKLPAGANLTIRFAMSGEAVPCYKVATEVDGKTVSGYLAASSIEGLDTFNNSRKTANWVDVSASPASAPASSAKADATPAMKREGLRVMLDAQHLIETGHPEDALRMLEPVLRSHPKDAALWGTAGVAAWKTADNRTALEYWRKSLDLEPNADIQYIYNKLEREVKNDNSRETLYGIRVVLRYDDVVVPVDTARSMVALVDSTYSRVSAELGCTTQERIPTIVQSREAYYKATGAAEWSGGLFDGRIHMPAGPGQKMDAEMQKALTHETVHACLAMMGQWPSWLHEGMAQRLSGEVQSPETVAALKQMAKEGSLPKLGMLSGGWSAMDSRHASLAYAYALAAVNSLYETAHNDGIRNLLRNPERLAAVTAALDKSLSE
jgi:tetratricopeptide (TPR) repeat protein